MQKVEALEARLWYVEKTIENGCSRSMLTTWIETDLYGRQGKAIHNFRSTLPQPQSDLAEQVLKDPYNFSFLTLDRKYREQELEQGLINHIQNFLIELGHGFAFVQRQKRLEIGGKEYVIDLLYFFGNDSCPLLVDLEKIKIQFF